MLLLPPAYKGATGKDSVGYDVYDTYDLGEFDQRGSVATKYGTRDAYLNAVQTLQNKGIEVLADIVLNHMTGADELEEVVAVENNPENREEDISEPEKRTVWTKYTFPGRAGKYSDFTWNYTHFNGTDWDEEHQQFGIFLFDDIMIAGDLIFQGSYGRTDLPSGNDEQMIASLKRVKELDGDYVIIPGHGPLTKLSYERKYNPLMGRL